MERFKIVLVDPHIFVYTSLKDTCLIISNEYHFYESILQIIFNGSEFWIL